MKKVFQHSLSPVIHVPLFQVIRDKILFSLYEESYLPGHILGTESELCQKYHVSRKTIRHALDELEDSGYLKRKQRVGIIITEKNLTLYNYELKKLKKVFILLPKWNYYTGNKIERIIAQELSNNQSEEKFSIEIRPFYDTLPEDSPDIYAVIAVDPSQQHLASLEYLFRKGVKIIAIEPQIPLNIAFNIYPDIEQAVSEAILKFSARGHRKIGLLSHFTDGHQYFRFWLDAFIHAMSEHRLEIIPYSILGNEDIGRYPETYLNKITAWICPTTSNIMTLESYLKKKNQTIPKDISVIGSDDPYDYKSCNQDIPISIYRPNPQKLCHLLRRLLHQNAGKLHNPGDQFYYSMSFVSRGSIAPCRCPQNI